MINDNMRPAAPCGRMTVAEKFNARFYHPSVTRADREALGLTKTAVLLSERLLDGVQFQLKRRVVIINNRSVARAEVYREGEVVLSIDLKFLESKASTIRFHFKEARYRKSIVALPLLGPAIARSGLFRSMKRKDANVIFARFVAAFRGDYVYWDKHAPVDDRKEVDHLRTTIPGVAADDFAFALTDPRNTLETVTKRENRARELARAAVESKASYQVRTFSSGSAA